MPWSDRAPLDQIVTATLPAGTALRRCYRVGRSPVAFWPGPNMRFGAAPRAMLYTGDTDAAAISETLLRDPLPYPGTNAIALPFDHLRDRGIATLRLLRAATLISLRRPAVTAVIQDAEHLGHVRALIETATGYGETECFARALLDQVPDLDVLAWPSRRADGHTVYCFYQGALDAAAFEVVSADAFSTQAGYDRLLAAVDAAGLSLLRHTPKHEVSDDDS